MLLKVRAKAVSMWQWCLTGVESPAALVLVAAQPCGAPTLLPFVYSELRR